MDSGQAKKLVLVATGGMVVVTTLSTLGTDHRLPSAKVPVGAFIAGMMLAVGAEFAPEVAGALAGVALISTVFVYGGPAFAALHRYTATPPK